MQSFNQNLDNMPVYVAKLRNVKQFVQFIPHELIWRKNALEANPLLLFLFGCNFSR